MFTTPKGHCGWETLHTRGTVSDGASISDIYPQSTMSWSGTLIELAEAGEQWTQNRLQRRVVETLGKGIAD